MAWASDLADGRPLADVELALGSGAARSDASGLARLALGEAPAPLLVARRGKDVAILPSADRLVGRGRGLAPDGAGGHPALPRLRRPEDVPPRRVGARQGLAAAHRRRAARRRRGAASGGRARSTARSSTRRATRSRKGDARVGGLGRLRPRARPAADHEPRRGDPARSRPWADRSADSSTPTLPGPGVPPARVRGEGAASEGPFLVGGAATVTVSASYYAGGALPGAEVTWRVSATPGHFRPPNRDDFVFGTFVPWWDARPRPRGAGARGDDGRRAPTAPASTACASTSTAGTRPGRTSCAPRPR